MQESALHLADGCEDGHRLSNRLLESVGTAGNLRAGTGWALAGEGQRLGDRNSRNETTT